MVKISVNKLLAIFVFLLAFTPVAVSAHQPRLVTSKETIVLDPEVSKAYYAKLSGEPQVYKISAKAPFDFYVNILLPDIAGQKKDVSVEISRVGDVKPLVILGGNQSEWKRFWEDYGRDWYWQGQEYIVGAPAGDYQIIVSSEKNDSKYALAIGGTEAFDFKEVYNAIHLVPQIKRDFFEESPINFILSPFGWGLVLIMYAMAFIFGMVYRTVMKKFSHGSTHGVSKNIGTMDRIFRLLLGLFSLLLAISTSWSLVLLFFSGFCVFEAIFSWCGFYAAIGKNSCPINV